MRDALIFDKSNFVLLLIISKNPKIRYYEVLEAILEAVTEIIFASILSRRWFFFLKFIKSKTKTLPLRKRASFRDISRPSTICLSSYFYWKPIMNKHFCSKSSHWLLNFLLIISIKQ